ncbi:MAG TPA: HAD-IIB family hydrolase [Candidatus Paceibacterota bacterium]
MINKKVIVCDLDGTLTASKSPLSSSMAEVLCRVLSRHFLVVISGGSYTQFQKQFLSRLSCDENVLQNLFLFPTNGASCYRYDGEGGWKELYAEPMAKSERDRIIRAFSEVISEIGLDLTNTYGDVVEDRGSQITFSGLGQSAPLSIKIAWDPNQAKRRKMVSLLRRKIPEFEIRIGGATSIDITHKGIDKAYAVEKIKKLLSVTDDDVVFVGDALYEGGNDESVKKTGVDFIQESGPEETEEFLRQYI